MLKAKLLFTFALISGILIFLILGLGPALFGSLEIPENFPTKSMFKKLFQTNYFDKFQFRRIDIWDKALNLIAERPLLGWGAGTFPIIYAIRGGIEKAQHTHSMPLEIAQTYGIPLSITLTCFVTFLFFKAWRIIFRNRKTVSLINKAWITSFLIIVISHISDVTYYDIVE